MVTRHSIKMLTPRIASVAAMLMIFLSSCSTPPAMRSHESVEAMASRLGQHVQTLASDDLAGRPMGGPHEARVIAYLVEHMRAAGLSPGVGDGWLQPIALRRNTIVGTPTIQLAIGAQISALVRGRDVAISARAPQELVNLDQAPIVFVGYGIHAPEHGIDDYAGIDVRGKVVLVLQGHSPTGPQPSDIDNFSHWRRKHTEAARRMAAGFLLIHRNLAVDFETALATASTPRTELLDDALTAPALVATITSSTLDAALRGSSLSTAELTSAANARGFRPFLIPDASLSARFEITSEEIISNNVIGQIRGARRPHETLVISAHWDHLGQGASNAAGDNIYNGAVDNALGVAALLETARGLGRERRPDRTIAFIAFTAEEPGLIGSRYYTAHPVFPLETTAAVINYDTGWTGGPTRALSLIGGGKTDLDEYLARALGLRGRSLNTPPDPNGTFLRSDNAPFAAAGVPALFIGPASEPIVTSPQDARSRAYAESYYSERYHTPDDEWNGDWDLRGLAQDIDAVQAAAHDLAMTSIWPAWTSDAERLAVRNRSNEARLRH